MSNFSDLPEDVMVKIWSFLPAKSVLRLKSVQNSWNVLVNALVKTPSFVADHLNNTRDNSSSFTFIISSGSYSNGDMNRKLVMIHGDGSVEVIDDPNKVNASVQRCRYKHSTMLANCDGMACLVEESSPVATLWNPATGEVRRVELGSWGENIAIGLGSDPVSGAYKLLVVSRMLRWGRISARVCTVGEDTWRAVETGPIEGLNCFQPLSNSGVCCGSGTICWIGSFGHREKMVCFDTNTEKFETVAAPTEDGPSWMWWREWPDCPGTVSLGNMRLGRWMESVELLHDGGDEASPATPVGVWVMSKTKKTWIKRFDFAKPTDQEQGLIVHDLLNKTYTRICAHEIIDRISLVPHVDRYNFAPLP